jgi:carboxyl-terminal processing protease
LGINSSNNLFFFKQQFKILYMVRQLPIGLITALAILIGGDNTAFSANHLSCSALGPIVGKMVKQHLVVRNIDTNIRQRIADIYIKRIDPSRTLFLSDEVARIRAEFDDTFKDVMRGDCAGIDRLHKLRRDRMASVESHVRQELTRDDWKIDPAVEYVIDREKRSHPVTPDDRRAVLSRMIQYRIANLLKSGQKLDRAKQRIVNQHGRLVRRLEKLKPAKVYTTLLDSAAKALDPHSAYMSTARLKSHAIQSSLALEGIGAQLRTEDGFAVVVRVIPGGAADRQGWLRPKDKIIAVAQDGKAPVDVIDWPLGKVVDLIRGPKGTKVRLTLLREGEDVETFPITIVRDTVDLKHRAAKIAYHTVERDGRPVKLARIELQSFYGGNRNSGARQAHDDVAKLLREAENQNVQGVLLDLSRNGGGLLTQAIKLAGVFLDGGDVVRLRGRKNKRHVYRDTDGRIEWAGPLVVLTTRRSASASEIVSAALQDHARALIVGDGRTFGKGTMQRIRRLGDGMGAIKATRAFFFSPRGRTVQNTGVLSDVTLPAMFNTDGVGEVAMPYTLIDKLALPLSKKADEARKISWKPISAARITRLAERSRTRVAASGQFREISDRIAATKKRVRSGKVRIGDLLNDDDGRTADTGKTPKLNKRRSGSGTVIRKGANASEDELSVYHLEALEILADHVAFDN